MDLQRLKQLSEAKIKAGTITKQVRDTLKEYKHDKQDYNKVYQKLSNQLLKLKRKQNKQLMKNKTN